MEALACVNRTFRDKEDGLLAICLAYAEVNPGPLNLSRVRGSLYRFMTPPDRAPFDLFCGSPVDTPLTSRLTVVSLSTTGGASVRS